MRMELIQPFINAADAVFAESLQGPGGQRASGERDGLRAGEHGHRKFRDAAERPGLSFQSVSAGSSHGRNGAGGQRGHGSAGDLHRDDVRRDLSEHCHALLASAAPGAQRDSGVGLR